MANLFCDKAYEALLQMITTQKLLPSMSLDVSKLASELNMSTTPVRDAIKRLEAEGLVEVIPRCGTFVKHFTIQDLIRCYEYAEALEGMAGFLLTERVSLGSVDAADLEYLDKLVADMEAKLAPEQVRQWTEYDSIFHWNIFSHCGNDFLLNSYSNLRNQMNSVLSFITPFHVDRQNSSREHREIVLAIRGGVPNHTRLLCQQHRHNIRTILIRLLG